MKRGVYFTLDALFAALIITTALVLLLTFTKHTASIDQVQLASSDAVNILNTLTVSEVNSTITSQVLATNLVGGNETVLRAIAVLWATNNSLSLPFTAAVFETFLPSYSYAVYAETDLLYNMTSKPQAAASRITTAKQQVSGIASGKPLSGSTAVAFLRKIENKSTASYAYFGGFVGQGNLTIALTDLPSDINSTNIRDVYLELDATDPFDLLVNGQACGSYVPVATANLTPDAWFVSGCNAAFTPGTNTIALVFSGVLDTSYVAGGFLRVRYVTDEEIPDPYSSPKKIFLPGIEGIVNLYDSFYVPGSIDNITIYLHYFANHTAATANNTFYLTIGNTSVYRDNYSNVSQAILLTDINLSSLNYTLLSDKTVPIRLGFENLTFSSVYTGNADVGLITDVSGSMDWRMNNNNNGVVRNCTNPSLNNSDTQRLSVAKCLDEQFIYDILNVSGNKLGLVNFTTATRATVPLTTNITLLNNSINMYAPDASTCICCGIINATNLLSSGLTRTTFIASNTSWRYLFGNGIVTPPGNDTSNNPWYWPVYANESTWASGNAVLGSNDNGSNPLVTTNMGNTIASVFAYYPNLWEVTPDNATPQVEFTSGLNSTGNTFGQAGAVDGWDWQGGTYGYSATVSLPGVQAGRLILYTNTTTNKNNCASDDCSGAYGITVNITNAMWSALSTSGSARLSFSYEWASPTNPFESSDEVWIKARWTNTSGTSTYLGTELSNQGGDNSVEITRQNDPDVDFSGTYTQDITSLITGPGNYYFDFGGKLFADNNGGDDEWGYFRFDDVFIGISNQTDAYYLRRNFTISNLNDIQTGILNVLSDDSATVYLNGAQLFDEGVPHDAAYWNVRGYLIPQSAFQQGTNTLAVRLENTHGPAKFDLELVGLNTSRSLAMLAMTDGVANVRCYSGAGNDSTDAILAACIAKQRWGITVHSVGFSAEADNQTLQGIAMCGGGLYASSSNTTDLSDFYKNVVINILNSAVKSQSIITTSGYEKSTLYNDSYLSFDFTPTYQGLQQNEISVRTQSGPLGNCTPSTYINPQARVLSGQLSSYSGDHWTHIVSANNNLAYNLSSYNSSFIVLGDPFIIDLSPAALLLGANNLFIETADSPTNTTSCSANNTLVTTLAVKLSTAYTPVLVNTTGCLWTVEHDDLTTQLLPVPSTYTGGRTCSYTNALVYYDSTNAYDYATHAMLTSLDYDGDGRIFISLSQEDIEIIVTKVSNVPYLWGPSLVEVRAWQ